MAYVLGFFAADGSMYRTRRGTHFIEFQITDGELLSCMRDVLGSNHKITLRKRGGVSHKKIYRLQIGSKIFFSDLTNLGFSQNKSKTLDFPEIPEKYLGDFLRGYFDGDGNIVHGWYKKVGRENPSRVVSVRFTCGSSIFLYGLKLKLYQIGLHGSLCFSAGAWRLAYGRHDSEKLFGFMYPPERINNLIYLQRKYKIFLDAFAQSTVAAVVQSG